MPAFHEFLGILGPLLGIAFGFDAINGERSQGTLPRLVSQPIHRDEIINGKFVAGLAAIALALAAVMAIVGGYGALKLGVGPTSSDLARAVAFYVVAVVYIGLWLAMAILFSVLSRRAATAALAGIAIWLFFTLFGGLVAGVIADAVHGVDANSTAEQVLANARLELNVRRFSPDQLYRDATGVLLNPTVGRPASSSSTTRARSRAPCRSPTASCSPGGSSSRSSVAACCCSPPPTSPSCARRCGPSPARSGRPSRKDPPP